jgi:hypothetical protein
MSQQYTLDHVAFSKEAMQGNMEIVSVFVMVECGVEECGWCAAENI